MVQRNKFTGDIVVINGLSLVVGIEIGPDGLAQPVSIFGENSQYIITVQSFIQFFL